MGRTVRFDQIYVTSMDADPLEQDVITDVKSILSGEIKADLIETSNLIITGDVNSSGDLELRGTTNVYRLTGTQVGVGIENPTHELQVSDKFSVDTNRDNLVVIDGNAIATNVFATQLIKTTNDKFKVDANGSNILSINGNTYTTNLTVGDYLTIGSDITTDEVALFRNGNVVIENGILKVGGNVEIDGNVNITRDLSFKFAENLIVSNSVIQLADGVPGGAYDSGLIMAEDPGTEANLTIGYSVTNKEFIFARTFESAYTVGGFDIGQTIPIDSNTVNLHVYGELYTDGNVGVSNSLRNHTLCVGSNVFIDDTSEITIYNRSNTYTHGLRVGTGGLTAGNGLLSLDPTSQSPAQINSNVQVNAIRSKPGPYSSGISNLAPTDTLSIGAKIFANITASNALTIFGNTVSTNIHTQTVTSSSGLLIHADNLAPDSQSNILTLRSGHITSNTSTIQIQGASTSNIHQNIKFFTKNSERMTIQSDGKIGIGTQNPTSNLTVGGNVHVTGSNSISVGNVWGTTGNTSMRIYSKPNAGENIIENIVATGKGLKIYASKTSSMGAIPKVSILETSNVGINVQNPIGRLHTSGGTVFINDQPVRRRGYNHSNASLVVSNTTEITSTSDMGKIMHLTREGTSTRDGVRTTFELGKHDNSIGKSKTKFSINLSDEDYTDDITVMSLLSNGKVGIGHTQPSAYLEVKSEGIGSARSAGLLVHNHENGDAIIAAQTDLSNGNAFSSYIQTDGDVLSGWSTGVSGTSGDFRIAQDPDEVNNSDTLAMIIKGTNKNVGIGTTSPREKFEVNGNIVIGNVLKFGGLEGSLYGNTQFIERRYGENFPKNELVIYKGNRGSGDNGKTRIRHIAAEHIFQTYDAAEVDITDENGIIKLTENDTTTIPLRVTASGAVIIGGNPTTEPQSDTNKLVVAGNIEFTGGGEFKVSGFEFQTLTPVGADSVNVIKNLPDATTGLRPLSFVHEKSGGTTFEFARFDKEGHFGVGTINPSTNVHILSATTTNTDVLKLESPSDQQNPGTIKQTGMLIYTDDGFGGYIRGYKKKSEGVAGIVLGSANNSVLSDTIWIAESSNVGIGTSTPQTKLHIYDGISRIEHSSSNALVNLKTTAGTSNILSDTTGNVYIYPYNTHTHFKGSVTLGSNLEVGNNLTVANDLSISGKISIGDTSTGASLQVDGGLVTNSDEVSCKKYSKTFTRSLVQAKDIQLYFGTGSFYAKVIAILRQTNGSVTDTSTMVLEVQGGTEDGSVSYDPDDHIIAVGTKNIFGGRNNYPWSPTVLVGQRGVVIEPANTTNTTFSYDIHVELLSSKNGSLDAIYNNNTAPDNTGGVQIATFDY
jgi:hypothetical protein